MTRMRPRTTPPVQMISRPLTRKLARNFALHQQAAFKEMLAVEVAARRHAADHVHRDRVERERVLGRFQFHCTSPQTSSGCWPARSGPARRPTAHGAPACGAEAPGRLRVLAGRVVGVAEHEPFLPQARQAALAGGEVDSRP